MVGLATVYRKVTGWAHSRPEVSEVHVVHCTHGNLVGPPRPIEVAVRFLPTKSDDGDWDSKKHVMTQSLEALLRHHVDLYRYDSLHETPVMEDIFRYGGVQIYPWSSPADRSQRLVQLPSLGHEPPV